MVSFSSTFKFSTSPPVSSHLITGDGLTREVDRLEKLWNDWEIRGAIVCSLFIQILLLITAGYRKRNYGLKLKAVSISIFLWFEYLLADTVAIFALGYLSQNQGQVSHLVIFWAPFLLLHLGGQDTITALSIEDNELWMRHLFTFISQAGIAIYVFGKSGPPSSISWAASFIFIAGILKYVERIWALQKASMSSLRSSTIIYSSPNTDLNLSKYISDRCHELTNNTVTGNSDDVENPANGIKEDYAGVVCTAYKFSPMFKLIFVDSILGFGIWHISRDYFWQLQAEKAYKLIEVELYIMYDILHTKAAVLHKWYGWFFRITTLICTITSLVIFTISNRSGYHKIEVGITYLLLVGAVVLETSALIYMLLSFWTYATMKKGNKCTNYKCTNWLKNNKCTNWLKNKLLFLIEKLRPEDKSRWSNSLGQCSLLNYGLKYKSNYIGNVMNFFGVKDKWDNFWCTDYKPVEFQLKKLIFSELKMKSIVNKASYQRFSDHRGKWTLEHNRCYQNLGWSVDAEFDQSILIWHIATDLLFHYDEMDKQKDEENKENNIPSYRDVSEDISNYMVFLLIVRPFMLPPGIGKIRFSDSYKEAKFFLEDKGWALLDLKEASKKILNERSSFEQWRICRLINKSTLDEGIKLADQLQKLFPINEEAPKNLDLMWQLISAVWVEMLCFAASKCGGTNHAKQLSMGGEFLTHVCFLMAHLGMGEEYRIDVKN